MATTTPNFGWDIPQSTDLVKDGATAIAALGTDIDTALVDLKGGTTGQVLSKASNTDLDFTWVAQDDSNAIQNAIVDAKGDLISATAADTPARLAVGTNGQVLTADSTQSTGLAWTTISAGSMTSLASGSLAAAQTGVDLQSISSAYNQLMLYVNGWSSNAAEELWIRLNNDTSTNYSRASIRSTGTSVTTSQNAAAAVLTSANNLSVTSLSAFIVFPNYKITTCDKAVVAYATSNTNVTSFTHIQWNNTAAINRITVLLSGGAFDAGTYELFGVK